jgi:hypothetical protein
MNSKIYISFAAQIQKKARIQEGLNGADLRGEKLSQKFPRVYPFKLHAYQPFW